MLPDHPLYEKEMGSLGKGTIKSKKLALDRISSSSPVILRQRIGSGQSLSTHCGEKHSFDTFMYVLMERILRANLQGKVRYCIHFIDEDTELQRV